MAHMQLAGENAIIIYFGEEASPLLSQEIAFYQAQLKAALADLIIDAVPSYTSLLLTYRVTKILHHAFCEQVEQLINRIPFEPKSVKQNAIEIPVLYDQSVGLDLAKLLTEKQMDLKALIALHTAETYFVYAVGFSPAFAFLGKLHPSLHQARHRTPRPLVPAGSVGIADDQTAIYPIASPGGWHIIGRTPWDLSLKNADNLHRFKVGQQVRFKAIDRQLFNTIAKASAKPFVKPLGDKP